MLRGDSRIVSSPWEEEPNGKKQHETSQSARTLRKRRELEKSLLRAFVYLAYNSLTFKRRSQQELLNTNRPPHKRALFSARVRLTHE